jgi:hypothetical protein
MGMNVEPVDANEVLHVCRRALALPPEAPDPIDETFLGALVRRAAGMLCPCSPRTLVRAVLGGLDQLSDDSASLGEQVDAAVERAAMLGDLLELHDVTTDDPNTKGTWVFAAPPAFVVRTNGSVLLMGVTPEKPNPLPPSIAARISYRRGLRIIQQQAPEDLPQVLRELGLLELSERTWLRLPKAETASSFRSRLERQLQALPPSGDVAELLLLDPQRDVQFYRGRWVSPKKETGMFVARRPQAYGTPMWGLAQMNQGAVERFLDFPPPKDRWRGCDLAWHLQMAIDADRGVPQRYRRRSAPGGAFLDFFGPLPLWAERRLATFGQPAEPARCLMSYFVGERELSEEEAFLSDRLWLVPDHKGEGE